MGDTVVHFFQPPRLDTNEEERPQRNYLRSANALRISWKSLKGSRPVRNFTLVSNSNGRSARIPNSRSQAPSRRIGHCLAPLSVLIFISRRRYQNAFPTFIETLCSACVLHLGDCRGG